MSSIPPMSPEEREERFVPAPPLAYFLADLGLFRFEDIDAINLIPTDTELQNQLHTLLLKKLPEAPEKIEWINNFLGWLKHVEYHVSEEEFAKLPSIEGLQEILAELAERQRVYARSYNSEAFHLIGHEISNRAQLAEVDINILRGFWENMGLDTISSVVCQGGEANEVFDRLDRLHPQNRYRDAMQDIVVGFFEDKEAVQQIRDIITRNNEERRQSLEGQIKWQDLARKAVVRYISGEKPTLKEKILTRAGVSLTGEQRSILEALREMRAERNNGQGPA